MKRVNLFLNGADSEGKAVMIQDSFEELLSSASEKFGLHVTRIFTSEGGEIDAIDLIRNDDILYVTTGEPFMKPKKIIPGCSNDVSMFKKKTRAEIFHAKI